MVVLSNLEPASVFYYFEEICGIPHTSHHEKALSDYCVQFAKAHGLACRQDEMGNVLIKAPATPGYEKEPGLILQGHLDMVGDKTADCPLDLEKDAIHPVVDGGYVCAEGTTLGGDDGIAVAYALAVLDAKDIPHPALEVVLTVCEEVGLLGASAMDFSDLEGRILVNIDSEEEGVLTAGCAGGRRVECHLPIARVPVTGTAVKADVIGLVGGHSGTEIHKGRANAIALLGRWLTLLTENGVDYAALALSGGAKENVIPKESSITLVLPAGITEGVHTAAAQFAAQVQAEYGTADPAICLQLTEQGCGAFSALDADSTQRLRKALLGLGQILLSGRACLEQRLGVLDGELRLLDADLRVLDGLFGRGLGRIVRLAQRGHGRGDRRSVHVQQDLPLRDLVALADAQRQHLTGKHREHLHLVVRSDLAVDRVFGAHRALRHLGHLNGGARCGLLLPVVARLAAAARAERHGCCEQRR